MKEKIKELLFWLSIILTFIGILSGLGFVIVQIIVTYELIAVDKISDTVMIVRDVMCLIMSICSSFLIVIGITTFLIRCFHKRHK